MPNYLDPDSDGDGVTDKEEAGDEDLATAPVDSDGDEDLATAPVDSDGDGKPDFVDLDADGGRVRVVAPIGHGPPGRPGRHGHGRRGWRAWREALPFPPPHGLVIEIEPSVAESVTSRALVSLVVSVAAAVLLLLLAAVFFWRQSTRAERIAAQLERDRQLAMLGEMSAVLGHEIKNPLASLKGHAQLLQEKLPADHPQRRKADRVVAEAVRLQELVGQVLAFVRSGEIEPAPADPAEVARAAAEQAGGEVHITAVGLPRWPLDRPRMEQALANLLRNAVQASPDGEAVDLDVRVGQDGLAFEVRDRGSGVPPGQEERIFEPFQTDRVRGTGLGLAVAKRIVDGHGGRIDVSNHPEGGAVFRAVIPGSPTEG